MPNPKLETYKNKATNTVYDLTDAAAQAVLAGILDGTDIDSFGDVETALDGKVDEVAGKGLSTNDYDNTAKGIVDNIQSNVIANTKLIKDTVGFSKKNKFENKATSGTDHNVTYTVNSDKSVTVNTAGTKSPYSVYELHPADANSELAGLRGDFIVSLGNTLPARCEINLKLSNDGIITLIGQENKTITLTDDVHLSGRVYFYIPPSAGAVNYTFSLMIRDANILDPTYEPYFGSTAFPRSEQAVLGARNLTPYLPSGNRVVGDTTFTVNDDGTVKINCSNNSAISDLYYVGSSDSSHETGYNKLGIPVACSLRISCKGATEQEGLAYILVKWTGSAGQAVAIIDDTVPNAIFNYDPNAKYRLMLRAKEGATFTDKIVNPLITLSTDISDDISPSAMTNRELTEKQILTAYIEDTTTASSNLVTTLDVAKYEILCAYGASLLAMPYFYFDSGQGKNFWCFHVTDNALQNVVSTNVKIYYSYIKK